MTFEVGGVRDAVEHAGGVADDSVCHVAQHLHADLVVGCDCGGR